MLNTLLSQNHKEAERWLFERHSMKRSGLNRDIRKSDEAGTGGTVLQCGEGGKKVDES